MSDSKDSTVTYMEVSSPFEDLSDIGSSRVVVYGYDGLPMHPPSPDYVLGPEHPPSSDYVPGPEQPPSPVYVPYVSEPAYPNFVPPEDDVLPVEEQLLPAAVLPTADSPGYITESNPEEDPEEDGDNPEEDPVDYPTDRDDDEEEEEESSGDDADEEEDEDEDEEEKEHLAPADSIPPPAYRTTAMMASMAMIRAAAPSTYILAPRSETPPSGTPPLLPIPLPTSSPPLLLPCRIFSMPTGGFRADYGFVATLDAESRREPDREIGYGITDVWEDLNEIAEEIPAPDVAELSKRMTDFITTVRKDTDEIYGRLDDAQDDRLLMSGQLNSLRRDRRSYARTARLVKSEARASREAWTEIRELRAVDRRRQTQLAEALTLLKTLQTQMAALQSQQRPIRDPAHPNVLEEAGSSLWIWLCCSYVYSLLSITGNSRLKTAPKRTTRSSPATTTTTTTPVTVAQLKALIDQGVANALVARDADRSRNGKGSHDYRTGVRRHAPLARECTYPNFMKCKPLYFKGIKGVVELT
uniref:Reverse transcriptase domain-containing protein n=1 Tax=Tanacetum cinerariifolium TaxID=118510 RepID=A0A6L2JNT4_TANCI|nr:hypothetical protein [Tanacetum cinerariifolium]